MASHHIGPCARAISTTQTLCAEPPKKKRRIDPALLKLRTERKIAKTKREIEKLESEPKQSIPILEYEYTNSELRELRSRPQHTLEEFDLTPDTIRGAVRLWSIYRSEQEHMASKSLSRVKKAQETALEQLRVLDKQLYDRTVEVSDTMTIPYRPDHMRRETPPNPDYTPPDGHIKNVSKEYVM